MAITLRSNFTKVFPYNVVGQVDQDARLCLEGRRAERPALVMHWVEEPGDRVTYHCDIAPPGAACIAS